MRSEKNEKYKYSKTSEEQNENDHYNGVCTMKMYS